MSYNKARAEKEWLKWKEAEEKKLRELGVDEDTIQRLYIERVKKALFKNLDNRIPAMRVRSRPDERRGKSAMTNSQTAPRSDSLC